MKVSLVLCHFSSFRFRFYLFSEIVSKLKATLAQKHTNAMRQTVRIRFVCDTLLTRTRNDYVKRDGILEHA